jgi:hypothetical protein
MALGSDLRIRPAHSDEALADVERFRGSHPTDKLIRGRANCTWQAISSSLFLQDDLVACSCQTPLPEPELSTENTQVDTMFAAAGAVP